MSGYFDRITGHETVKALFQNALQNDRVFSSYVFKGPEGIGKKLTAIGIAALLNCEQKDHAPCGTCLQCMKIETGNHVDVMIIEAEKDAILVEQIEDIIKQSQFPPFEGKKRVFIIDDAHLLGTTSANMLLKTLEEPIENNHFFLITSKPDSLLPTIRSRSQEIFFRSKDLEKHLYLTGLSPESIKPFITMGGGYTKDREVIDEFTEERRLALRVVQTVADTADVFDLEQTVADYFSDSGKDRINRFFQIIELILRDILVIKKAEYDAVSNQDLQPELVLLEKRFHPDDIFDFISALKKVKTNIYYNVPLKHMITLLVTEGRRILS